MKYPQVIVLESNGQIVQLLHASVAEHGWLVREIRKAEDALELALQAQPTLIVVEVTLATDGSGNLAALASVHHSCPDVPIVAVSDDKLPDADRAAATGLLFDLGARYVLFPPIAKTVIEDVVSGLMAAAIRRTIGSERQLAAARTEPVVDLADQELVE